jgi:hypothetical protein
VIGYYVHHHGRGHLVRAQAVVAHLTEPVTVFSSLPRPEGWVGEWVVLPLDTAEAVTGQTAYGRLHWVPTGVPGLRDRMAAVAEWIARTAPTVFVVDVSVEIALLARLHGVPVITLALPGEREDAAHRLGYDISDAIIATWPASAGECLTGVSPSAARRVHHVGGLSRYAPSAATVPAAGGSGHRHAVVLTGAGGDGFTAELVRSARQATPGWRITHLGGGSGRWVDDPWDLLRSADVVVVHAGQNAIADVAAARRPAVVVPQSRPYGEQAATARVLAAGPWPVTVVADPPEGSWATLLERAAGLDGGAWSGWVDGAAAPRTAQIFADVAGGRLPA